jgi:hypothetical protein
MIRQAEFSGLVDWRDNSSPGSTRVQASLLEKLLAKTAEKKHLWPKSLRAVSEAPPLRLSHHDLLVAGAPDTALRLYGQVANKRIHRT